MIKLHRFSRSIPVFVLSILAAGALHAQYVEVGDAGTNLGTGQSTGVLPNQPLNSISGSIATALDGGDFFYITITNPALFSASTVGGSTLDTMLYLFTVTGNPVFLNDDAPGGLSLQSNLPAGTFSSLAAGTYIIGLSLSGAEPINGSNQQLFADGTFSTDIRGARPGALGPVTGLLPPSFSETGLYTISLTGALTAVIPEPSTVALLAISGVGALVAWRRRSRNS
jgi:hypothetical protein